VGTVSGATYTSTITVGAEHLDDQGHVNNAVYVRWIQEIAAEHWYSRHPKTDVDATYWVVLEHHIQYKQQSYLGDSLKVETYIEDPEGIRLPRIVDFFKEDQLIVKARTLWCLIDAVTHRPSRINNDMLVGF
jgi:acyl-CoA thioester hydrolase